MESRYNKILSKDYDRLFDCFTFESELLCGKAKSVIVGFCDFGKYTEDVRYPVTIDAFFYRKRNELYKFVSVRNFTTVVGFETDDKEKFIEYCSDIKLKYFPFPEASSERAIDTKEELVTIKNGMDFHKEWKSDEITELYNLFVRELIGLYMIEVIIMIENKTVTRKIADEVFAESIQTWESPESIVKRKGLQIEKDDAGLEIMIKDSIKNNPVIVEKFKAGNDKAINALKGPILKASKGKIDPNKLDELFRKFLA